MVVKIVICLMFCDSVATVVLIHFNFNLFYVHFFFIITFFPQFTMFLMFLCSTLMFFYCNFCNVFDDTTVMICVSRVER